MNLLAVIFIAINLRAPITSIGPMVDWLKDYFSITSADVGLLGSIVLTAFGSVSFLAIYLHPIRGILLGILLIVLGEVLRSYLGYLHHTLSLIGLFGGTMIMGSGIAIANVLLPSFITMKFANQIPKIMGIYSFTMSASVVFGTVLALPLLRLMSLPNAMGFWIIFALLALIFYLPQLRESHQKEQEIPNIFSLFFNFNAWKITLVMGLQSLIAYSILVWYPKMIAQKGFDLEFGANMAFLMQIVAIPFALFMPIFISALRNRYKIILAIFLSNLYGIGCLIFLFFDSKLSIILVSFIYGIPIGGVFSLALLFISVKARNIQDSVGLSAMVQGFGYLIASFGPYLIGKLYDVFDNFYTSLWFLIITSCLLCIFVVLSFGIDKVR